MKIVLIILSIVLWQWPSVLWASSDQFPIVPEESIEELFDRYHQSLREGAPNPEIGIKLIRKVTFEGRLDLYEQVNDIYFGSFMAVSITESEQALESELDMLKVIMPKSTHSRLLEMLANQDSRLLQEITDFWLRQERLYSTNFNERLFEHWERIHHARREFTKDDNSVYQTDDRGPIYVRFGEPSNIYNGIINWNGSEIRNKLFDLLVANHIRSNTDVQLIANGILQDYSVRDYEVWIYDRMAQQEDLIYIFGISDNDGLYRKRRSLEEFISRSLFNKTVLRVSGSGGLRAGHLLQFMMYNELSIVDSFFGQQLQEFEENWNRAISGRVINTQLLSGMSSTHHVRGKMETMHSKAPDSQSDMEKHIPPLNIEQRTYTFYGDSPGIIEETVVTTYIPTEDISSFIRTTQSFGSTADFKLVHGFQEDLKQDYTISKESHFNVFHNLDMDGFPGEIITVLQLPEFESGIVFSELYYYGRAGNRILGRQNTRVSKSKSGTPDGMYLSDIVIGSSAVEPVQFRESEIGLSLFDTYSSESDLEFYVEIYNVSEKDYELEIELNRRRGRVFTRWQSDQSILLQLYSPQYRQNQFFSIPAEELQSGEFQIKMILRSKSGETEDIKNASFELK